MEARKRRWRLGANLKRKREIQESEREPDINAPKWVIIVPRLQSDLKALMELMHFEDPPRIQVWRIRDWIRIFQMEIKRDKDPRYIWVVE